ncbi:Os05g0286600 [Oryza sativa Japonica Group]|uniref:Os05g0286600 protein n=1 Tax=Oryza sativa subsp. japonica TaxID=39947 RepID=A0A0P0WKD7_ORYSJ|nr:Os05g0286600 [Oryza sativa Japonica Group]
MAAACAVWAQRRRRRQGCAPTTHAIAACAVRGERRLCRLAPTVHPSPPVPSRLSAAGAARDAWPPRHPPATHPSFAPQQQHRHAADSSVIFFLILMAALKDVEDQLNWQMLKIFRKRKFAIDGRAKDWLLHQLDGKWRQYKSNLKKKYYKANLPMERVLQMVPQTVNESQWPTLVSYWYSEDSKKISDQNQENAQNIKHPHKLGRKSFARKRKELEHDRVEVDRATFFDECHKTKDGRYVNDATQDKMNEVYMKLAEKRVDGQELTEADFEQAMLEVFGKDHSGRVRGMGPTITPTNYYGGRFLNMSGRSEQGSSSSNVNGFISFMVSYLAEKYPEDNLMSRLPPSLC